MDNDYCFRCGVYTAIDRLTKMCRTCYDQWCGDSRQGPRKPEA